EMIDFVILAAGGSNNSIEPTPLPLVAASLRSVGWHGKLHMQFPPPTDGGSSRSPFDPKDKQMKDKADVIKSICGMLSCGDMRGASQVARLEYPFCTPSVVTRHFTENEALRIFVRDGFVDRYSGKRLLFPPVLRLLSFLLPEEFPFHRNWKMKETHPMYWDLFPTLDHIIPIARGGSNDTDNIISTSMLRNNAKSNWTLEELGWTVHPPGDMDQWDGMLGWFVKHIEKEPITVYDDYINKWYRVARQ
ncbi:MAG: hypothetical protein AB1798_22445, partial [Spirochaetota bacterium]